jgi:hypothetical protein
MIRTLSQLDDLVVAAIRAGHDTAPAIRKHLGLVDADFRKVDLSLQRQRKRGRVRYTGGKWHVARAQDVLRMTVDLADLRLTRRQLWSLHLLLQRVPKVSGDPAQVMLVDDDFATLDARELEQLREVARVVDHVVLAMRKKDSTGSR